MCHITGGVGSVTDVGYSTAACSETVRPDNRCAINLICVHGVDSILTAKLSSGADHSSCDRSTLV